MRKVLVFTGHRAEGGHVDSIIRGMREHGGVTAQPVLFSPDLSSDTLAGQAVAFGNAIGAMVPVYERLKPDFALVYGDRSEAFAAALAAARLGIPVAHVEGGDETYGGCLDDAARHSLTKLACLHFTTTEEAAAHVLALGEEAWRVKVVGLPILDYAEPIDPETVRRRYELGNGRPLIVFCQHPVAAELDQVLPQIHESIAALLRMKGCDLVIIAPNGDAGSADIRGELCRAFGEKVYESIPVEDFHGLLKMAGEHPGAFLTNSSAGLKEAPHFGCPTVNIGSRQAGRLRGPSVVDVPYDALAIVTALGPAVFGHDHYPFPARSLPSPYKALGAGRIIAETLATCPIGPQLTIKRRTT